MNLWKKIIAGEGRITRLHDELGNFVPISRLIRNGPRAMASLAGRLAFDRRPVQPWISYDAQRVLDGFLKPDMRVLEFGSGMSTAWYAARSAEVVSIEDYRPWYEKVRAIFVERGITNVRYRVAEARDDYITLSPAERDGGFDMVMIDGSHRDRCADLAMQVVKPGGIIYLDNADKAADSAISGDCAAARETLIRFAGEQGGTATLFTDFSPTQFFAQSGLLVRLPPAR